MFRVTICNMPVECDTVDALLELAQRAGERMEVDAPVRLERPRRADGEATAAGDDSNAAKRRAFVMAALRKAPDHALQVADVRRSLQLPSSMSVVQARRTTANTLTSLLRRNLVRRSGKYWVLNV
jgi:hypothetical protein